MLKLNVFPHHIDVAPALGINPDRAKELARMLDEMMKHFAPDDKQTEIRTVDVCQYMANRCENIEEYTYCVVAHITWLHMRGRALVVEQAPEFHNQKPTKPGQILPPRPTSANKPKSSL